MQVNPTIDDLIELPAPGDAQLSPDGEHIVYTVRNADWEQNQYINQIWIIDVHGGAPRQLTFARQSSWSPRWSPDGQTVAFLSKRDGDSTIQIYQISPFGGESKRLTKAETDVHGFVWSPDGSAIAFLAIAPASAADKQRRDRYGDFRIEDADLYYNHLWLYDLAGKTTTQLTAGSTLHVYSFDWHPASDRIVFDARPVPDLLNDADVRIYTVDLATRTVTVVSSDDRYRSPHYSPDGSHIVFVRPFAPIFHSKKEACVMTADGQNVRVISADFDESVFLRCWTKDGIYFGGIVGTSLHLFRLNPDDGGLVCVTPKDIPGWLSWGVSFNHDYSLGAFVGADMDHYGEVMLFNLSSGQYRRLTNFNDHIRNWDVGTSEVIQWESHDGTIIEGLLTKPSDFDPQRQYPLLVIIHGGPTGTLLPGKLTGHLERHYFPLHQWVAKGALVLQPNYRGSAGYGEKFRGLNVRNLGIGDYWDVVSGVDALIAQGCVDPERVGTMGWSQGGYISAFLATYCDRFKAASVGAGISNWYTYYINTDVHFFTRDYLGAAPWEDREIYEKTSPISYIRQAKTPTLIQHGDRDFRVPVANAYELYQGLQDMGVETKLLIYPGQPHDIQNPKLNRQLMTSNFEWFNRFIWGENETSLIENTGE